MTLIILAIGLSSLLFAQDKIEDNQKKVKPFKIENAPLLDGEVLNDSSWGNIAIATGFWQTQPDVGAAATERTEVKISFSTTHLYVAVVCYDNDPTLIVVKDNRRDASLEESDSFSFILDTFNDDQNGLVFGTNPMGAEYDAQVRNQAEGSWGSARLSVGSGGNYNVNWDASWEVASIIHDKGWSAEFKIPFTSLRFGKEDIQTWGINFERNIYRKNERVFWAKIPPQYNLGRVSLAGDLEGLEVPDHRNLKFIPYGLGQGANTTEGDTRSSDLGFDAKYTLSSSMTLDMTYNTDFAQVEVDEQQVNLDRFSLFFPEKRSFFLENAGLFSVAAETFFGPDIDIFFSRNIGIGSDGEEVPILGGARLTGNISGFDIGAIQMRTNEVSFSNISNDSSDSEVNTTYTIPANDYSVFRLKKEFDSKASDVETKSSIGFMGTRQQTLGLDNLSDGQYLTGVIDGQYAISTYGLLKGFAANTYDPSLDKEEDKAYHMSYAYNSPDLRLTAEYSHVGEAFSPKMGFLKRSNYNKVNAGIYPTYRFKDVLGVISMNPHVNYTYYQRSTDGVLQSDRWHIHPLWFNWRSGAMVNFAVNKIREKVFDDFSVSGVQIYSGLYEHWESSLWFWSNRQSALQWTGRIQNGGYFGGQKFSVTSGFTINFFQKLQADFNLNMNDVSHPNGDFRSNLYRLRMTYSFSARLHIQALLQYNEQSDTFSTNLRLSLLGEANTGLFLVFNEIDNTYAIPTDKKDRIFILKYSRMLDFKF